VRRRELVDDALALARRSGDAPVRRFDDAWLLAADVALQGRQVGLPDTERLVGTLRGAIVMLREDPPTPEAEAALEVLPRLLASQPRSLYEATAARLLVALGRPVEAGLELQRALPRVLAYAPACCDGRRVAEYRTLPAPRQSASVRPMSRGHGALGRCVDATGICRLGSACRPPRTGGTGTHLPGGHPAVGDTGRWPPRDRRAPRTARPSSRGDLSNGIVG
jgi:hypothetical protein